MNIFPLQFQKVMKLVVEKYSVILKMALTDIWVLLADSAESCCATLHRFLHFFKDLSAATSMKGQISGWHGKN
jgi:hypothetical protein